MNPNYLIPVVNSTLYTPASRPMLNAVNAMRPAIRCLVDTLTDPKQREAIGVIWHQSLELQAMLRQIEDVERDRERLRTT